jgi:outer membrane protein TolC
MGARRSRTRFREGRAVVAAMAAALAIGACARFSPDAGMSKVQASVGSKVQGWVGGEPARDVAKVRNEDEAAQRRLIVTALLAKPVTADTAVQVALLNNRGLQAAYNEVGISEARMVEASLPPSPMFALTQLSGNGGFEIERQVAVNVLALLTLPSRKQIAAMRFNQEQVRAVEATLRTAAEARRAYYRAVAAGQVVKFLEDARLAAESVSDLARQLGETGALSKLDQAREHAFYAEVSAQLALGRLRQRTERDRLVRVLGLWGSDINLRLPDALDPLPARPTDRADVEVAAVVQRVDMEIAWLEIEALAKQLKLTRGTRFINELEVGRVSMEEKSRRVEAGVPMVERVSRSGTEFEFQIPIYDFGKARTRVAEETYMQAVNRLLERAVNVRSEAREAYQGYRGAYDLARHYEREILPLREIISEETLQRYSGMLQDVFALLTDARARIASNVQGIEARRDFWIATVDLHTAIVGGRGAAEGVEPGRAVVAAEGGGQGH